MDHNTLKNSTAISTGHKPFSCSCYESDLSRKITPVLQKSVRHRLQHCFSVTEFELNIVHRDAGRSLAQLQNNISTPGDTQCWERKAGRRALKRQLGSLEGPTGQLLPPARQPHPPLTSHSHPSGVPLHSITSLILSTKEKDQYIFQVTSDTAKLKHCFRKCRFTWQVFTIDVCSWR